MTADNDKRANRRVPVALRIRLRYEHVDQFISKFAVNISRGGMFLSSRNPKAVGTHLHFEMRLADDSPIIEGSGEVRWIREYDRDRPNDPYGMGIQFAQLSPESRKLIERIIEHRRSISGLEDDDAIPHSRFITPDGADSTASASLVIPKEQVAAAAARRLAALADAAEAPTRTVELEPVADPLPAPSTIPAPALVTLSPIQASLAAPLPTPEPEPAPASIPDPVPLAAPLPMPSAGVPVVAPPPIPAAQASAPAPARNKSKTVPPAARRRSAKTTSDLVGYLGSEPPAVRAALERARALAADLAGGDLDRELLRLLGDEPEEGAPVEVTVDAASRELAERLGGKPVEARRAAAERAAPASAPASNLDDSTGGAMPIEPGDVLEEMDADDVHAGIRR